MLKKVLLKIAVFSFSAVGLLATGCGGSEISSVDIESYMQELVSEGNFNGNVLVVKNGEILYENSFGFADASKTTQLTKDYRFGLGSTGLPKWSRWLTRF